MQVQVQVLLDEMNEMDGNYFLAGQATCEIRQALIIGRVVTVSVSHLLPCGEICEVKPNQALAKKGNANISI